MARWFSWRPPLRWRGREFRGIRGWAGKPTHPPLTDFPVVCYILAGLFDFMSFLNGDHSRVGTDFFRAGTYVIVVGAVVSLATALTGFWDWLKGVPKHTEVWRTANAHLAIMLLVTALVIADIALRFVYWREAYTQLPLLVLSLLALVGVSIGSLYGGSLVYDYGFNVEASEHVHGSQESEEDRAG